MKNIYYEAGPDTINVGPKNAQILMTRGISVEFDDKIAAALLKKPLFKEGKKTAAAPAPEAPKAATK
jgi:hypothetical protein